MRASIFTSSLCLLFSATLVRAEGEPVPPPAPAAEETPAATPAPAAEPAAPAAAPEEMKPCDHKPGDMPCGKACDHKACDHKSCDHKACDHKACDHKSCDHKACDHKPGDKPCDKACDTQTPAQRRVEMTRRVLRIAGWSALAGSTVAGILGLVLMANPPVDVSAGPLWLGKVDSKELPGNVHPMRILGTLVLGTALGVAALAGAAVLLGIYWPFPEMK